MTDKEKIELGPKLLEATPGLDINAQDFYKVYLYRYHSSSRLTILQVRYTRVSDLVERRKVLLKGGWAYVPTREQSSIVFAEFQTELQKALEVRVSSIPITLITHGHVAQLTAKHLPRLDEDNRLVPILNHLSQGFLAGISSEWGNPEGSGEDVRADMVDDIARKHYPMCMRNLHENLRRDRHLKHFGRLQYGLFLKVRLLACRSSL